MSAKLRRKEHFLHVIAFEFDATNSNCANAQLALRIYKFHLENEAVPY